MKTSKFDKLIKKILDFLLRIIHLKVSEKNIDILVQFIKFGIVGVTNVLVNYVVNVMVLLMLKNYQLAYDYVIGNIVGFLISVFWSFCWNNRFVFVQETGKKRSIWKTLIKTYISYGFTGFVLNVILSYIWIDLFEISKFIAPLINSVVSVPINFIINKKWAFKA